MANVRQIGLIGNSIKTNELPTPSESTYAGGNRFYTLIGIQDGYETGHTYRTIKDENGAYVWEDVETAGLKLAIPLTEKGEAGGVATLNENGKVPENQLPQIPTAISQLTNDSDFVTDSEVSQKFNEMGIHCILPSELTSTPSTSGTLASKWSVNGINGITEPFHGMLVTALAPDVANSYLVFSLDGGQTYHPVVTNNGDSFGNYTNNTAVEKSRPILIMYNAEDSANTYITQNNRETIQGVWYIVNSTDKNDRVQLIPANNGTYNKWTNIVSDSATDMSSYNSYATLIETKAMVNPYTGEIDATKLYEDGEALEDKYALKGEGGDGSGGTTSGMPVIRLVTVSDMDQSGYISVNNPLRITIEVVDGEILENDVIEICDRKSMTYKSFDEHSELRKKGRRWRYRHIVRKSALECHPDKSLPEGMYRMKVWEEGDAKAEKIIKNFLRSNNMYDLSARCVTKYVRVTRMLPKDLKIFSNEVPIVFSVSVIDKTTVNDVVKVTGGKINLR